MANCPSQAPAIVETEKVLGKTKSGRITKGPAKSTAPAKKVGAKKAATKKAATPKKKMTEPEAS
jgi:histone H1/5